MRTLLVLAATGLLAVSAIAQEGEYYELRYRPEPGREAHYQGVFHGDVFINKLPASSKELNGRMHLKEQILPSDGQPGGAIQRLTFVDAKFQLGPWDLGFSLHDEYLTVRRGEDLICTELIDRPPAASVESGDIIGVVASLPWAIVFPDSGRARIGQTWRKRLNPAPPDVGQPIGPDTIYPRKMLTTNTLVAVTEHEGRQLATIDTQIVIEAKEGATHDVTIRGPAEYWLDTGELHSFHGDMEIYVGIDISSNLVEIIMRHALLHFEERDPSEIDIKMPPSGPWEMKFEAEPEDLLVWSYPVEPEWLVEKAGITPPPGGKSYALNRKRLYENGLSDLPKPRTPEAEDEWLWEVVAYAADRLFYLYLIDGEMSAVDAWASALPGVQVEPIQGTASAKRLTVETHPELLVGYFYSEKRRRPILVVTDDPELWERALQSAGTPEALPAEPDAPKDSRPRSESTGRSAVDRTAR